jgi:hypothetical protein
MHAGRGIGIAPQSRGGQLRMQLLGVLPCRQLVVVSSQIRNARGDRDPGRTEARQRLDEFSERRALSGRVGAPPRSIAPTPVAVATFMNSRRVVLIVFMVDSHSVADVYRCALETGRHLSESQGPL